ncbi:restriction endonuclease subunit S [Polaribacter sp. R77954]|uniref:restriction endonuclease subunit S n=1 Tax=Polaribacter sp. R77954 TaxID=3093870 RepID=UPI0037CA5939
MKKYETYKKVKDLWIKDIPESWRISEFKYYVDIISGYAFKSTDYSEKIGFPIIRIGDIYKNVNVQAAKKANPKNIKELDRFIIKKGDLLLAMTGATIGKNTIFNSDDLAYVNQRVGLLRAKENLSQNFLKYYIDTDFFEEFIRLECAGAAQENISSSDISELKICIPTLKEQTQIAKYLDHKTQIIDALIDKKEELIKKLQAQRQAIINEAVTKGLNKNAPLKDSGIEWLGKINTQWVIKRIKHTTYVKGRIGWQGLRSEDFREVGPYLVTGTDFIKGRIKWETCHRVDEDRYDIDPKIQLKEDDVLITKDGTIGKIAIVKGKPQKVTLNTGVFVTRPLKNDYLQDYFYWLLTSEVFTHFIDFNKSGATIQHLYQNVFNEFSFALPVNLKEQKEIIDYLDEKTRKMDLLLEKVKNQIKKLKSFRQSIISEAVTGKIDVRDWQPPKK